MSMSIGFETIRNNTALKLESRISDDMQGFETIRNNTALKPITYEVDGFLVLKPFETTQL